MGAMSGHFPTSSVGPALLCGLAAMLNGCNLDFSKSGRDAGAAVDGGPRDSDAADKSDAGPGNAATFTLGEACSTNATLGCGGLDSAVALICSGGTWKQNATCDASQRCDTRIGKTQGLCLDVVAECAGRQAGDDFCRSGQRLTCGPDRVTEASNACGSGYTCEEPNGSRGSPDQGPSER